MDIPASAQRFADAAIAAGMTVTYEMAGTESWTVNVISPSGSSASVTWSMRNTATANSRLGFVTWYNPAVRFDYATVTLARPVRIQGRDTHHPAVASISKVRQYLNF